MKRILLTSAGLSDSLKELFFDNIGKKPNEIKIIFIPFAATKCDSAREGISICVSELIKMGIKEDNIFSYNLEYLLSDGYERTYSSEITYLPMAYRPLTTSDLGQFDAIIFCGGDASMLMKEMNRTGFDSVVRDAVERGLFYIGVSAGSMVAAGNFKTGLRFIENEIIVHSENGSSCAEIPGGETIFLKDGQAIYISGREAKIVD